MALLRAYSCCRSPLLSSVVSTLNLSLDFRPVHVVFDIHSFRDMLRVDDPVYCFWVMSMYLRMVPYAWPSCRQSRHWDQTSSRKQTMNVSRTYTAITRARRTLTAYDLLISDVSTVTDAAPVRRRLSRYRKSITFQTSTWQKVASSWPPLSSTIASTAADGFEIYSWQWQINTICKSFLFVYFLARCQSPILCYRSV